MKVELLTYTPDAEKVVASAAKLCYSKVGASNLMDMTDEQVDKFLNILMDYNHESPIEHVSFTFAIEGVSRSLTHQLTRHRLASYSQQSQRYVKLDQFEYITPDEIAKDSLLNYYFIQSMNQSQKTYDLLVEGLMKNGRTEKEAIEDARYVFPNACETKIVVTMNTRSLLNFFSHRECNRAQWEIRQLAEEMMRLVKGIAPTIFKKAGAPCRRGKCPEGKMSCGIKKN